MGISLEKLDVKIQKKCAAKSIVIKNNLIDHVLIEENGVEKEIHADIYVFAVPVEIMQSLIKENDALKQAAPSVARIENLHTEASSGIQYFCIDDIREKFPKVGWHSWIALGHW